MNKITNELNLYYKTVNDLIDKYIEDWGIKPSRLKSYLNPGTDRFRNFVKKCNISDYEMAKKVIIDVINDRESMELDKIKKFESFKIDENVLTTNKSNIEHEKVIADLYNTSLGHIEVENEDLHLFKINDFGKSINVIIFSDDELNTILDNLKESSLKNIKERLIQINDYDHQDKNLFKVMLSEIIDEDLYKKSFNKNFTKEKLINYLLNIFNVVIGEKSYKYRQLKGYHLWEIDVLQNVKK